MMSEVFRGDNPELQYEADNYRNRENRGRRAGVYANFLTTGSGVVEFEDPVEFGLTYVQQPWMSYGAQVDMDSVRDALDIDQDDPVPFLPIVTGYVTDWRRDTQGNYTGAWVAVSIYMPVGSGDGIEVDHMFTFDAVAIKDVPFR